MPCKYIIHTPGPIWHGGGRGEKELLTSCYKNSLALAAERNCETLAVPLISAGIYGYPKAEVLKIATAAVTEFLAENDMTVYIVVFTKDDFAAGGKLFGSIESYIDDVYAEARYRPRKNQSRLLDRYQRLADEISEDACANVVCGAPGPAADWDEILNQVDEGFSGTLLRLIDDRHMTDAQCYKSANIDRRLFSKIRSNADYKPTKNTVLALAVALKLDGEEASALLRKAGYALSPSNKMDLVLQYCFDHGFYDVNEINQILFSYDLPLLGSATA